MAFTQWVSQAIVLPFRTKSMDSNSEKNIYDLEDLFDIVNASLILHDIEEGKEEVVSWIEAKKRIQEVE